MLGYLASSLIDDNFLVGNREQTVRIGALNIDN